MTLEDRVAFLESLLARYLILFDSPDGTCAMQYAGRTGIQTRYWADQVRGQGAALAIGSSGDRFAVYAEVDQVACQDKPSAAIYASCVAVNPQQPNIAVEAHALNGAGGNNIALLADGHIAVGDSIDTLKVGKIGHPESYVQLWPKV